MPKVILTGSICQHVGGLGSVDVAGTTARAAILALQASYPSLRGWVIDEQGSLRKHVKIYRAGVAISLDTPITPDDELHIVAAISGG
jgi:sulfur-carrier protein